MTLEPLLSVGQVCLGIHDRNSVCGQGGAGVARSRPGWVQNIEFLRLLGKKWLPVPWGGPLILQPDFTQSTRVQSVVQLYIHQVVSSGVQLSCKDR